MLQITESVNGRSITLSFTARLDIQMRKLFQEVIKQIQAAHSHKLILNLAKDTFIESSTIGVLILAHRSLE